MTTQYRYIPTVKLAIPSDVTDPAVRYAATEAFHAASARCKYTSVRHRRNAIESAVWVIGQVGFGAFLVAGARRVRDMI